MKIQNNLTSAKSKKKNDSKKVATVTFDLTDLPSPGGRFFQIGTHCSDLEPFYWRCHSGRNGYDITTYDIKPNESPIIEYRLHNTVTDNSPTFVPYILII